MVNLCVNLSVLTSINSYNSSADFWFVRGNHCCCCLVQKPVLRSQIGLRVLKAALAISTIFAELMSWEQFKQTIRTDKSEQKLCTDEEKKKIMGGEWQQ